MSSQRKVLLQTRLSKETYRLVLTLDFAAYESDYNIEEIHLKNLHNS